MSTDRRTFFLIDADNVSLEVIEKGLLLKQELHRALHVRRCYCSADFAAKNLEFLKEHSIRAMVNATAGKNCTDIALAVDAVQLCGSDRPSVVVIVASDSDFAPLAIHLRELGCRVEGVGQEGKTGAESHRAYDDFIELPGVRKRTARPPRAGPDSPAEPVAPRPAPAIAEEVLRWLEVVPGLASGSKVELGVAAEALRKEELLSRNAPSTKLFKKYPELFDLAPAKQPNSVRYAPMTAPEAPMGRESRGRRRK